MMPLAATDTKPDSGVISRRVLAPEDLRFNYRMSFYCQVLERASKKTTKDSEKRTRARPTKWQSCVSLCGVGRGCLAHGMMEQRRGLSCGNMGSWLAKESGI